MCVHFDRCEFVQARALSWPGDYEFDEGMNGNPDQRVGTIAYGGAEAIVECT